jgi:hypothetical protein
MRKFKLSELNELIDKKGKSSINKSQSFPIPNERKGIGPGANGSKKHWTKSPSINGKKPWTKSRCALFDKNPSSSCPYLSLFFSSIKMRIYHSKGMCP